jgi:hypothetical protein
MIYRWNGRRWSMQEAAGYVESIKNVPVTVIPWLSAVSCGSRAFCTAVGGSEWMIVGESATRTPAGDDLSHAPTATEQWNGSKWSIVKTPKVRAADLSGVWCDASGACVAVGSQERSGKWVPLVESTIKPTAGLG